MAWTTDVDGKPFWLDDYVPPTDNQVLYDNSGYTGTKTGGNVADDNQSEAETNRLGGMERGDSTLANGNVPGIDVSSPRAVDGTNSSNSSMWEKFAKAIGLTDKNGNYSLQSILGTLGKGALLADGLTSKPQQVQSVAQLRAGMPAMNTAAMWTPEQIAYGTRPMQTGSALQRVYASDMPSPLTAGAPTTGAKHFAVGGEVPGPEIPGALTQAFSGAVQGTDGGQSDLVDAKLSPGEYVLDAETVSALGDGNTAAGIAKLDELRQQLRAQKRGAPNGDIPPPAQGPLSYMGGN